VTVVVEQSDLAPAMEASRTRRCIVSGDILPEGRLLRFVAGPDRDVVPDVEAKLPGRGLWVRADRQSIEHAATKGLFARAAREPLKANAGLAQRAEARLVERMLNHLGLSRRAGEITFGFDQVDGALRGPTPPALRPLRSLLKRPMPRPTDAANCRLRHAQTASFPSLSAH
jgi:predicted RNA-binding protein YlxR (DUF448 family)